MSPKNYNAVSLIRKKREKESLTAEELAYLVDAYTRDELPDYQMSAFLMAAFLNGMDEAEAAALTRSMLHSGIVLDLGDIPGTKVDKHSTGGVGDKLSLILAPIVASWGVPVPMISGRGLGHTGGTLDKLESITGFTVDIDLDRYKEILKKHRMVMAGQTEEVAPADKRLYALRDVTATVESIPLIAGSIMSKKLAEGIDALVLDVKYGSGAFMKDREQAIRLAETLVGIGERFGKETIAYLTNMEQPLGHKIGNWLEVEESLEALRGNGPKDVMEVTHLLAGTMIYLGGEAKDVEEGIVKSKEAVENGQALQKWMELCEEQGGNVEYLRNPDAYPKAGHSFAYTAEQDGYISAVDAYRFGMASLELGAGRRRKEDAIDPVAGIVIHKKIGDRVESGETIATGYTNKEETIETAREWLASACTIDDQQPAALTMISHVVDKKGTRSYEG